MSFSTTAIKYGWVYLTVLGVLGTTIYKVANTRQQVKPEDIIEIALGVHERCLATQYDTNLYYVDPPSIVRTWTDAGGASIIVTNTIGWHTDRAMMVELDAKIKALIPYYIDPDSWGPATNSFGSILTVTGLFATLQIGDKTNKFTRTPAIGTNVATYGDYPWQIYVEDLQERYKVLNAMERTVDNRRVVTNQSWYGLISSYWGDAYDPTDPWTYKYKHLITGAELTTLDYSHMAMTLGEKNEWEDYYKPTLNQFNEPWSVSNYYFNNTNYGSVYSGFSTDGTYNVSYHLTWNEVSVDFVAGAFWGYGDAVLGNWPAYGDLTGYISGSPVYTRFTEWDTRRTNSLPLPPSGSVTPGICAWAYKYPDAVGWGGGKMQGEWQWGYMYYTAKAKWSWFNSISNEVPNTLIGVFAIGGFQALALSPRNPVGTTEIYSGSSNTFDHWTYPQSWSIDTTSPWGELAGLAHTNYTKLSVNSTGDWLYVEFGGADEVTGDPSSMPSHPAAPTDSGNDGYWGSANFWDNTNSQGTAKGVLVSEAYIVRDWDFEYCVTKYW